MPLRKRTGNAQTSLRTGGSASSRLQGDGRQAYLAGKRYGSRYLLEANEEPNFLPYLNRRLRRWVSSQSLRRATPSKRRQYTEAFIRGFCRKSGNKPFPWLPMPTKCRVAAIITAKNGEKRIGRVLDELRRLPLAEIIVVVNGSDDDSYRTVRKHPSRPILIHYDAGLGYDVGRVIGARASVSDILLFVDADIAIRAEKLLPFVAAVDKGADIALNDISPFLRRFDLRDSVSIVKEFMNRSLGRADLAANSLTAVPHALSRKAVQTIGFSRLAVPPLAQAAAIMGGLRISAPAAVDVIRHNLRRTANRGRSNPVDSMIFGDHLEALHYAMREQGARLRFQDGVRTRHLAGG